MADAIVSGIYRILNTESGKCYIGSAVNCQARFRKHNNLLKSGNHHSIKLQRAWDMYGADAFRLEVVEIVSDTTRLIEKEQHWIDKFDASRRGYNVLPTAGSRLGSRLSESAIQKRTKSRDGYVVSEETRKKMSVAMMGKRVTEEAKMKISMKNKGRLVSMETRAKLSAAKIGRKLSPESVAKMRATKIGKKMSAEAKEKLRAWHTGRKMSESAREKMRQAKLGSKASPTSIAKQIAFRTGRICSIETRAKISAALKAKQRVTLDHGEG